MYSIQGNVLMFQLSCQRDKLGLEMIDQKFHNFLC